MNRATIMGARLVGSSTSNPYEAHRREVKLKKLINAADAIAREGGLDPALHATGILESWKNASALHFAALIERAKVLPPSDVTFTQFFDALASRAVAS